VSEWAHRRKSPTIARRKPRHDFRRHLKIWRARAGFEPFVRRDGDVFGVSHSRGHVLTYHDRPFSSINEEISFLETYQLVLADLLSQSVLDRVRIFHTGEELIRRALRIADAAICAIDTREIV
jgi:hypothetical protein